MYLQEFGEQLSEEETLRKAKYLLGVYLSIFGLPGNEHIDNEKEKQEQ